MQHFMTRHKACVMHEASLKAAKEYYRRCTQAAILLGTLIAALTSDYTFVSIAIGTTILIAATITGGTIENRAYLQAHDRMNDKSKPIA